VDVLYLRHNFLVFQEQIELASKYQTLYPKKKSVYMTNGLIQGF